MKVECRSEDRRRAPDSNTNNGRDKAQESQSRFRIGIVLVPSALFRGHSVGANSPDRLIKPIPSPGKLNAGATRPFFAPLALCDFAFNSGAKKSSPSHRVAVSRSDVGEGFHLAALLKQSRKISDNRKIFGNISEKQPFSEIISDLLFGKGRGSNQARSTQVIPLFFAALYPCACVPSGAGGTNQRTVARMQRRRIKLNQSGSK
jgi:hypothetical protein